MSACTESTPWTLKLPRATLPAIQGDMTKARFLLSSKEQGTYRHIYAYIW